MNQNSRLSWALGLSLLIWTPVVFSMLGGHVDVAVGGLYYLCSLAFAWIGTGFIMGLTANYRRQADELDRAKREIEEIERRAIQEKEQETLKEQRRRAGD